MNHWPRRLLHCTRHVYGRLPQQVAALDVVPDEDPEQATASARALAERINDRARACSCSPMSPAQPHRALPHNSRSRTGSSVLAGVNLPLLLRSLNYRRGRELEALVTKVLPTAREAIEPVLPDVFDCGGACAGSDASVSGGAR